MALKMKDKSKVTRKYSRVVLTGLPSIGKSTAFGVVAKKAIVLDLERRWPEDQVAKHDFPEMVENYSGVKELLNNILAEAKLEHDFIVLDSATALLKMIRLHSIAVDFRGSQDNYHDYSKGDKSYAPNYMQEVLTLLDRIAEKHKVNIGIVCHTYAKPQANPLGKDYQKQCLDLPDRVAACVMQWADLVGFAFQDVAVQQDGLKMKAKGQTRVITFNDSPSYEAKNGSPYALPDKIPFDKEGKWAEVVFGGTQELLTELDTLLAAFPAAQRTVFETLIEEQNVRGMNPAQLKDFIKSGKEALIKIGGK